MDQREFDRIRDLHDLWLFDNKQGEKAVVCGEDFIDLDMADVNLHGAEFVHCRFDGSNMRRTDFAHANLRHSTFTGADLMWANFGQADMYCADLEGAIIEGAYFNRTILMAADLTGADMELADFKDANLVDALGPFATGSFGHHRAIAFKNGMISVGCTTKTLDGWREDGLDLARVQGYSALEFEAYLKWAEMAIEFLEQRYGRQD